MTDLKGLKDRAIGCLYGAAVGDAMGMPASFLTRKQIKATYGYINEFLTPDRRVQDVHSRLDAGDITDDTYETIIMAKVLIENEGFDEKAFSFAMKDWALENKMLESDLIGPSTRKFLASTIKGEDTKEGAKTSDTNGSAMRVAPLGIYFHDDTSACLRNAAASSLPSHGSVPAVAAACAVAMACACGIKGGFSTAEIMIQAAKGAEFGENIGHDIPAPSVSKRILFAKEYIERMKGKNISEILDYLVAIFGAGMKSYESIPLSLGIFYAAGGDLSIGIPAAVNAGDDADTNGSICGAICGAYSGFDKIPPEWVKRVKSSQGDMDLEALAQTLIR